MQVLRSQSFLRDLCPQDRGEDVKKGKQGEIRMSDNDWIKNLKNELVRINRLIEEVRRRVNKDIDTLKLLEKERKEIVDTTLNNYEND